MAGKLSSGAAVRVAQLEGFVPKVGRLHSLVETYATARANIDTYQSNLKRNAEQLKLGFMTAGLDQLSQLCGSIAIAAHRAGSQNTKTRILRELIGSLRFQLDFAIRNVIRDDELERSKNQTSETSEA